MKKLLLLMLLFCSAQLFAQTDTATMYVDANYKQVDPKNAMQILRVFQKDSNSYVFLTYDKFNVIQKRETYFDQGLTIKHGQYLEYKNGKPALKGMYANNKRNGGFISFDTLGRVTETETYVRDTLNGPYTHYWPNGSVQETGAYKNAKKVGDWTKHYENGNLAISEKYNDASKVENAVYLDIEGKKTTLDKIEAFPAYPGGIDKFYNFIGRNLRYTPASIPIQGLVRLSFVVTETGDIENLKVDQSLSPELDAEALRVMKLTGKWIPGKRYGKNIRVLYKIPINFSVRQ